jgi:prepilin-type N-terminal cleavage/methylation domain-containing protein
MISKIGNNKKGFTPLEIYKLHKKRRFLTGFTLIEVMVTTVVLALTALLVYEAFFITLDTYNYCYNYLNVLSLANEKVWQAQDDLATSGVLSNIEEGGEFTNRNKKFLWSLSNSLISGSALQGLYRIDFILSWREGKRVAKISRTAFAIYAKK